jgi:hypothetical protein
VATTGIHQRDAIRQLIDNGITGVPQQIVGNVSGAPNEAMKWATFACVAPANSHHDNFHCLNFEIYSASAKLNLCISR